MPKYPLIISNSNYVKCLQICAKKGCSMGRLLNDFVTEGIKNYDSADPQTPKCSMCKLEAVYRGLDYNGHWVYYCEMHFNDKRVKAYKKIGV